MHLFNRKQFGDGLSSAIRTQEATRTGWKGNEWESERAPYGANDESSFIFCSSLTAVMSAVCMRFFGSSIIIVKRESSVVVSCLKVFERFSSLISTRHNTTDNGMHARCL